MIALTITEQMSCDNICMMIQRMINNYQTIHGPNSATGKIISIRIHDVTEGTISITPLAIESKN